MGIKVTSLAELLGYGDAAECGKFVLEAGGKVVGENFDSSGSIMGLSGSPILAKKI